MLRAAPSSGPAWPRGACPDGAASPSAEVSTSAKFRRSAISCSPTRTVSGHMLIMVTSGISKSLPLGTHS